MLHLPLTYSDSYIVPDGWNPIINTYIKQTEYAMALCQIISGALCLLLEKHNFKHLDDHYRVPIYMCTGSSLCFFFLYGVSDLAELLKRLHHSWWLS